MRTRILSGVLLLPLLIFVVVSGGLWLKGCGHSGADWHV